MPQINYDWPDDLGLPGTFADVYGVHETQSFGLESLFSTWTVTIAGTIAISDEMSVTVVIPDLGVDETVSFVTPTGTATAMAAGLVAAINANENLIPVVLASNAAGVITVEARGQSYQLDVSGAIVTSAAGTIVAAETVLPGNSPALPGLACVLVAGATADDGRMIRLPTTGDAAVAILGVIMLSTSTVTPNTGDLGDVNVYRSGATVPVARKGCIWVEPENALAVAGGVVWVRLTAGAGEQAGAFRNDTDGGDAVALTNARWHTNARTINGKLRQQIMINRPE